MDVSPNAAGSTGAASSEPGTAEPGSRVAARGTVQMLIGRGLFMVGGYVIAVVLARGLGPVAYGAYGLVMSLLVWLEVAGDMGVQRVTIKMIPGAADPRAVAQTSAVLMVGIGLVFFGVCWAIAPLVADYFQIDDGARLFRIAIIDIPLNALYLAWQGILQGYQRFGTLSVALTVYTVAKLAGVASLIWLGMTVEAALIVNVLATVVALVYVIAKHRPGASLPAAGALRSMMRAALPVGVFVMTTQFVLAAHLWSLKRLSDVSDETVGFYVAALNLARLPTVVPFVLGGVVLASVSAALARGDETLAHTYIKAAGRFILLSLLPVSVLGALDSGAIMQFVFSESYTEGSSLLALLLGAFCLFAFLDTLLHGMIADGRYYQVSLAQLALVPVALGLNFVLIPRFGAIGAATAFLLTLGAGAVATLLWTWRRYGVPIAPATVVRVTIATAAVGFASTLWAADGFLLVVKLAALMLAYAAVLALLRELGPADLKPLAIWKRS